MFKIQKLDLLISVYIACVAISELMGGKTFFIANLGFMKLNSSVAIFVVPLVYTINDVITEVYGKDRARSIVRSGLVVIFILLLFSLLATNLPPSLMFGPSESAYEKIFGLSARIAASSLTAFAMAEFLDVFVFAKLKEKFGSGSLWLRTNVSNFVSQFVDTTAFMFLAFYSFGKPVSANLTFLISLIIPYYLLKCFMSVIETPVAYAGVKWLRGKGEK